MLNRIAQYSASENGVLLSAPQQIEIAVESEAAINAERLKVVLEELNRQFDAAETRIASTSRQS